MKPVQYTVRLPATLNKALRKLAEQQGITPYAALRRSVVAGINAQANAPNPDAEIREMVAEVASMGARLADVERIGPCSRPVPHIAMPAAQRQAEARLMTSCLVKSTGPMTGKGHWRKAGHDRKP